MKTILALVAALALVAGIAGIFLFNPVLAGAGFVQFVVAGSAAAVLETLQNIERESKEQTKVLREIAINSRPAPAQQASPL